MPTIEQIRAARALLGWNQHELAEKAGLSQTGIARIENGTNQPNSKTLAKINGAFDRAGIEFIGVLGLHKRSSDIKTLNGKEGFEEFMDDVYLTAKNKGGDIRLHNANSKNWDKWLENDWYQKHSERMARIENISFKITTKEGDGNLIAGSFAQYRWWPEEFHTDKAFYAYGGKLAFLDFMEDDIEVTVFHNEEFYRAFVVLFDIAWKGFAEEIPKTS